MPELPEVESIRRGLCRVKKQKVRKIILTLPRLLQGIKKELLEKKLKNKEIIGLERRGKYLIFEFETASLIIHLGMSGQLTFIPKGPNPIGAFEKTVTGMQVLSYGKTHKADKHTHLKIHFSSGDRLFFRDIRTFGKIFWTVRPWINHPRIASLGPEPLGIHPHAFLKRWPTGSKRMVKPLLLDQKFIAGVGNIYADEALFLTKLHPAKPANEIEEETRKVLFKNIRKVLRKAIKNRGTSFAHYRQSNGRKGSHQQRLLVYGRGGRPCKHCHSVLVKTTLAQRGSVFCPTCQL